MLLRHCPERWLHLLLLRQVIRLQATSTRTRADAASLLRPPALVRAVYHLAQESPLRSDPSDSRCLTPALRRAAVSQARHASGGTSRPTSSW
ncbi:hypothetical protein [Ktedonobacter sp. SOSP1-85]|uniref:hypothetical protein n=1 Tax=Ktedonobacter sp. SOSP1-85 TaxID=2778367 RepID=UPI00191502A7|nr:hypothetical protein [Ktedonobacter sp. SOSP1-85]